MKPGDRKYLIKMLLAAVVVGATLPLVINLLTWLVIGKPTSSGVAVAVGAPITISTLWMIRHLARKGT
jgi:hypothetical protein